MVRMKVGDAYHVDGFDPAFCLAEGDLGPLAAVDQNGMGSAPGIEAGKPAVLQRHHAAGSWKTNI